jgi:hypothetical protein
MSKQFDNTGTVSIWERDAQGNAPIMSGTAYAHRDIKQGEAFDIALWYGKSQNPKAPKYTGKVSDPYKPEGGNQGGQQRRQPAQSAQRFDDFDDSEVPF